MEEYKYSHHLGLAPTFQFKKINITQKAYKAAIFAENSITSSLELIHQRLSSVHGFPTSVSSLTNSSKSMIIKYKEGKECFGCHNENHRWCNRKRDGILCPKRYEHGVKEAAEKAY